MSSPVSYDLQGQGGGQYIDSSSGIVNGDFRWIQVITDTVFDNLISGNINNIEDVAGLTISAGIGIGGRFSTIALASGVVIAYYV